MKILIDIDGTLIDTHDYILPRLSEKFNRQYTKGDIFDHNYNNCLPDEEAEYVISLYQTDVLYRDRSLMFGGALNALDYLQSEGHDVRLVSFPMKGQTEAKLSFCRELKKEDRIDGFYLTNDRRHIKADLLIDDYPMNIESWSGESIIFHQIYNKDFAGHRIHSWPELPYILREIKIKKNRPRQKQFQNND